MKKMAGANQRSNVLPTLYDRYLLFAALGLLVLGLLMVASSSIVISNRLYGYSFHFLVSQGLSLLVGLALIVILLKIEMSFWEKNSSVLLLVSLFLLMLVLVPGIGRHVNGSARWLGIGPFGIQVSEFAKIAIFIYLASYVVRHQETVKTRIKGFLVPLFVLAIVSILLLKEPDFGATSVILATALGMLFLAGVRLWQFAVLLVLAVVALAILAISSPYRLERLTTFLNPWANQFDSGYQLTQALIAFGRGGWLGIGLGESVQKLLYLPEAHTDFLFAVLAEELGLIGIFVVMALFLLFTVRALAVGRAAQQQGHLFPAYLAYGLALAFGLQAMINIGVNIGVLPTKGLTLPFMSYGRSSLLANCIGLGLLLRIDYETRLASYGLKKNQFSKYLVKTVKKPLADLGS